MNLILKGTVEHPAQCGTNKMALRITGTNVPSRRPPAHATASLKPAQQGAKDFSGGITLQ